MFNRLTNRLTAFIEFMARLFLVPPDSSTEAERSFSALRRLKKTWLHSTMTQLRLNSICHVHQERLDLVDVNALTEQFISRNDACVSMFGK